MEIQNQRRREDREHEMQMLRMILNHQQPSMNPVMPNSYPPLSVMYGSQGIPHPTSGDTGQNSTYTNTTNDNLSYFTL